jgi:hypothetical protein
MKKKRKNKKVEKKILKKEKEKEKKGKLKKKKRKNIVDYCCNPQCFVCRETVNPPHGLVYLLIIKKYL